MRTTAMALTNALFCLSAASFAAAQTPTDVPRAVLYSPNKYRSERKVGCVNIQTGPTNSGSAHCDVRYGNLWAGDELDWFQSATGQGDRSVIRDLGSYEWSSEFEVPVVTPLPKLMPGEQRSIAVDTSGADGADGQPGATSRLEGPFPPPAGPRHDGKPKVDPVFVKAIPGHMYVVHVVDDTRDFYALFRVESLERGDNCTVSWKAISAPKATTAGIK